MKDFLTVKEFAQLANKKEQTIYKQLDKRLKPYVRLNQGKKEISAKALKDFYGVEQPIDTNSTDFQPSTAENPSAKSTISTDYETNSTAGEQPFSTVSDSPPANEIEQIAALNKLIEIVQKQLEEKDKQLAVKDKQIADLSDRLAEALQLTKGQQYIAAADKTKELIEADTGRKEPQEQAEIVPEHESAETTAAAKEHIGVVQEQEISQKKKSFFARLFGL